MFHGSMVALITPMDASGQIDWHAFQELIEWHIESKTTALIIAGTTGEGATLTLDEKLQLVKTAVEVVANRIPVIAGTYAESTTKVISMVQDAMHVGADGVLIMAPAYIKPTQEGLYLHYAAIAREVAIPQIVYNVPSRTQVDLLPQTLARLKDLPNIVGIKEATGSINRLLAIQDYCDDKIDVYSGDDATAADFMLLGAKGVISVTANVCPEQMAAMSEAAIAKDKKRTKALDKKLQGLHTSLFMEANPIPCKWAVAQVRNTPTGIRLPLTPLSAGLHQQVQQAIQLALSE